ncbi:hypothetical protein BDF19DRAFT_448331 [Syncephalis fuscata]|nr:hypothetical protein BDF19DRAFT_448331 [Syncephalis fuscata]
MDIVMLKPFITLLLRFYRLSTVVSNIYYYNYFTSLLNRTAMTEQDIRAVSIDTFFSAIQAGDTDAVRALLATDRSLSARRHRYQGAVYHKDHALDAYKFLGAYIGAVTGLQLALLSQHEIVAKDILTVTFNQDIDLTFGDGNTALHLAVFLGLHDIVTLLVERGANTLIKNGKGFTPVDVSDRPDVVALLRPSAEDSASEIVTTV